MTTSTWHKAHRFDGRRVMVGFGCVGHGVLPLLLRHIPMQPAQIALPSASDAGAGVAQQHGVVLRVVALTPQNHEAVLAPLLGPGDGLLNLSVNASSVALIPHRRERHANDRGSSPTPVRWRASLARVASRPRWAGAATNAACLRTGGATPAARKPRSDSFVQVPAPGQSWTPLAGPPMAPLNADPGVCAAEGIEAKRAKPEDRVALPTSPGRAPGRRRWYHRRPVGHLLQPMCLLPRRLLALCRPYLGDLSGVFTDWTPLQRLARARGSRRSLAVRQLPRRLTTPQPRFDFRPNP